MAAAALEATRVQLGLQPALRQKLVAHRGWHHLDDVASTTGGRPLQNTRQAYIDAASLGAAYAECDVWVTQDGYLVLSHDFNFAHLAEDPSEELAQTPIRDLEWDELRGLRLGGGAAPVLLLTVMQDLLHSDTLLAVELKSSACARPLAACLAQRPELLEAVGFVLSFSLEALEIVASTLCQAATDVRLVWLVDNPSAPYLKEDLNEGETTFDYAAESLPAFLESKGLTERVRRLGCGLHLQYNPKATVQGLLDVRAALHSLCGESSLLGIWSDRNLDPGMDSAATLFALMPALDLLNSDLPDTFFGEVGDASDGFATGSDQDQCS